MADEDVDQRPPQWSDRHCQVRCNSTLIPAWQLKLNADYLTWTGVALGLLLFVSVKRRVLILVGSAGGDLWARIYEHCLPSGHGRLVRPNCQRIVLLLPADGERPGLIDRVDMTIKLSVEFAEWIHQVITP